MINKSKLKKSIYITSIFSIMVLLCVLSPVYCCYNKSYVQKPEIDIKWSVESTFPNSIWESIKEFQPDDFELEVEIFGYRIISEAINPIEYDYNGLFHIKRTNSGVLNIMITLKYGSFIFKDISTRGTLIFDTSLNYYITYNLDDPKNGFFMDLFFFTNKIQIDLAFDGGDCQLCYVGVFGKGYKDISPIYPDEFEKDLFQTKLDKISVISPKLLKDQLIQSQKENIIVNNQKYLNEVSMFRLSFTKYGVVHESYDFSLSYPEDLPDDYWEPYTSINIGIYRYLPSEAQIKSDLQYYNKDFIQGLNSYIRNILAYHEISHGGPSWSINGGGVVTPTEISQLWYYYYDLEKEIDIHPWDAIIIVDACYSYYNPSSGTNPTMAKAFVDYGADAFVGSTIIVPEDSDDFMRAFWYDICQDNENVRTATISLCDTYGNNWSLGDEWRIYGDQYKTLA